MFASTAIWPKIRPPTILTIGPTFIGTLVSASLKSSNAISIKITSTTNGNGTASLEAASIIAIFVGKISIWYVTVAIYNAGKKSEIIIAVILINFKIKLNGVLRYPSSLELNQSIIVVGITPEIGELFVE